MVGPEDLPNAIALNSSQLQLGRLAGPALGGVSIALVGVSGCFFLNSASFVAVLVTLLLMKPARFFPARLLGRGRILGQLKDGLKYAISTPNMVFELIMMSCSAPSAST